MVVVALTEFYAFVGAVEWENIASARRLVVFDLTAFDFIATVVGEISVVVHFEVGFGYDYPRSKTLSAAKRPHIYGAGTFPCAIDPAILILRALTLRFSSFSGALP